MSHEIRTPLNVIIGMTSIAKNAGETAQKDHCLKKIADTSVHLMGVINDILDISKIESETGRGSAFLFTIKLPRAAGDAYDGDGIVKNIDVEKYRLEGRCILLAEDVEINRSRAPVFPLNLRLRFHNLTF
jgi:signal transduction histidine kinase